MFAENIISKMQDMMLVDKLGNYCILSPYIEYDL